MKTPMQVKLWALLDQAVRECKEPDHTPPLPVPTAKELLESVLVLLLSRAYAGNRTTDVAWRADTEDNWKRYCKNAAFVVGWLRKAGLIVELCHAEWEGKAKAWERTVSLHIQIPTVAVTPEQRDEESDAQALYNVEPTGGAMLVKFAAKPCSMCGGTGCVADTLPTHEAHCAGPMEGCTCKVKDV
ncbi:MAG: hypothetical protein CMK74_14670 [Pseudomonadales bacterium]|nr:hypothetical protein [Pseudomonadales bacterium]